MVDLALRWAMTNTDVTVTLVGARKPGHIDTALAAFAEGLPADLRTQMAGWN